MRQMSIHELKKSVSSTYRRLASLDLGTGASGNVSARCNESLLITPSGVSPAAVSTDQIVPVNLNDEPLNQSPRPSSEWRMHRDIYRSFDAAQAVVHTHPPNATALACLRRDIPAFHYMVAVAGGNSVRCARYAAFGSQALSDAMLDALDGRRACLLANHGLIVWSDSLGAALTLTIEVESLARQYLNALAAGEPALLSDEDMAEVHRRFRDYRAGNGAS